MYGISYYVQHALLVYLFQSQLMHDNSDDDTIYTNNAQSPRQI